MTLLLAAGAVLVVFLWQGHQGFSLADEGYLWYGAQRVMAGEVPIRDFQAYDPGRYYWCAMLMALWGNNGIMALRGAVAIFQTLGLFIGFALISRNTAKPDRLLWLLAAVTLVVWMFPRHKLFDISLSIALVGALSLLVQQPSNRRYFLAGLSVGLAAVFGRNHGMYGIAGSLGVLLYLAFGRQNDPGLVRGSAIWAAGVVIGYLPVLLMILLVPGYAHAFGELVTSIFDSKATNIPLPVPWPWRVPFGRVAFVEVVRGVLVGLFFIAIVVNGVAGIAWVIWQRLRRNPVSPALVASVFLGLPYAHFAYSRADVGHLAQGIFPFLIGSFVVLASQPARIKWPLVTLLSGASLLVMIPFHPGWQCYASQQCVEADVAGDKLKIDPGTASALRMLNKLAGEFAPGDRSFIAAPWWPGAYAVLGRKSPLWSIYVFGGRSTDALQESEIERIKISRPGFAIVIDVPVDGRDELSFRNTHPMVEQYICDHFEPLTGYAQNPTYQIYKRKDGE